MSNLCELLQQPQTVEDEKERKKKNSRKLPNKFFSPCNNLTNHVHPSKFIFICHIKYNILTSLCKYK